MDISQRLQHIIAVVKETDCSQQCKLLMHLQNTKQKVLPPINASKIIPERVVSAPALMLLHPTEEAAEVVEVMNIVVGGNANRKNQTAFPIALILRIANMIKNVAMMVVGEAVEPALVIKTVSEASVSKNKYYQKQFICSMPYALFQSAYRFRPSAAKNFPTNRNRKELPLKSRGCQ